jgi:hypothetical protein
MADMTSEPSKTKCKKHPQMTHQPIKQLPHTHDNKNGMAWHARNTPATRTPPSYIWLWRTKPIVAKLQKNTNVTNKLEE